MLLLPKAWERGSVCRTCRSNAAGSAACWGAGGRGLAARSRHTGALKWGLTALKFKILFKILGTDPAHFSVLLLCHLNDEGDGVSKPNPLAALPTPAPRRGGWLQSPLALVRRGPTGSLRPAPAALGRSPPSLLTVASPSVTPALSG